MAFSMIMNFKSTGEVSASFIRAVHKYSKYKIK